MVLSHFSSLLIFGIIGGGLFVWAVRIGLKNWTASIFEIQSIEVEGGVKFYWLRILKNGKSFLISASLIKNETAPGPMFSQFPSSKRTVLSCLPALVLVFIRIRGWADVRLWGNNQSKHSYLMVAQGPADRSSGFLDYQKAAEAGPDLLPQNFYSAQQPLPINKIHSQYLQTHAKCTFNSASKYSVPTGSPFYLIIGQHISRGTWVQAQRLGGLARALTEFCAEQSKNGFVGSSQVGIEECIENLQHHERSQINCRVALSWLQTAGSKLPAEASFRNWARFSGVISTILTTQFTRADWPAQTQVSTSRLLPLGKSLMKLLIINLGSGLFINQKIFSLARNGHLGRRPADRNRGQAARPQFKAPMPASTRIWSRSAGSGQLVPGFPPFFLLCAP